MQVKGSMAKKPPERGSFARVSSSMFGIRLRCVWLLLACFTPVVAHPGVSNGYDFSTGLRLGEAALFSPWWSALQRNRLQQVEFDRCLHLEAVCRVGERPLRRLLQKAGGLSVNDQLELVNRYINRVDYEVDRRARDRTQEPGKIGFSPTHWSTLYEFLRHGGDCEDYAAAKYFLLRRLGLPAENLRVVVAWERELRGFHAVLAYRWPNSGDVWLLESDNRIKKRSHAGYRYVYAVNELSVWDYRPEGSNLLRVR